NYVEIIQNKAHARRLIEVANEVAEDGFDGSIAVEDLLDSAEKRILEVTRTRKTDDFKSGKEVVQSVVENIYRMRDNKTSITGVKTGYRSLDRLTNGLQRGDLIILAARPSVGKTAFALNLALKTAKYNDQAVAIFSLEMPAEHLISRMLAVESGVPGNTLKTGKFANDDELNRTNSAASSLSGLKIYIDDSSMIKTSEVFSKCRRLQAEHGLALIVIDYIQLISGSAKSKENRQQEVSEISRNLKALARELNVPVVALSQLSRGVESRTDKKPMLSDLRESGSIEQDADIVMMLYRSEYYENRGQEENSQEVEVIVGKHRNGATGILKMFFTKDVNTFTDMDNNFN
ncbi:MAG: replicative DNA helicase, partial [Erysipelotrichaceae bacterium]